MSKPPKTFISLSDFSNFNNNPDASRTVLDVHAFPDTVDAMIQCNKRIQEAEAEIKKQRIALDALVSEYRLMKEEQGQFSKTCHVHGTESVITYQFTNNAKSVGVENEAKIRQAFGTEVYDTLFTRTKTVKVKSDKLEQLIARLGKEASEFVEFSEAMTMVSDYREKRFELRSKLDKDVNVKLDMVVNQFAFTPSLKFK